MPNRPYIFYELTNSICSKCLRKTEAKVIFENDQVFLVKHCRHHGREKVLISTDIEYYKKCREFLKRAEMPYRWNTSIQYGARMIAAYVRITSSTAAWHWWKLRISAICNA